MPQNIKKSSQKAKMSYITSNLHKWSFADVHEGFRGQDKCSFKIGIKLATQNL